MAVGGRHMSKLPCEKCTHHAAPFDFAPQLSQTAKAADMRRRELAMIEVRERQMANEGRPLEMRPYALAWCRSLTGDLEQGLYALCNSHNPKSDGACGRFRTLDGIDVKSEAHVKEADTLEEDYLDNAGAVREISVTGQINIGDRDAESALIEGRGLVSSYGIFGQPGQGKTHLLKRMIRQALDLSSARGESAQMAGGLVSDQKCELKGLIQACVDRRQNRLTGVLVTEDELPRLRLLSLGPDAEAVNVLSAPISARELGKVLALTCASTNPMGEGYFAANLGSLLSAVSELFEALHGRRITLRDLTKILNSRSSIERFREENSKIVRGKAMEVIQDPKHVDLSADTVTTHLGTIDTFVKGEKADVQISLFRQTFGEFAFDEAAHFSKEQEPGDDDIFTGVFTRGDVILVAIPAVAIPLRRALQTLTKCLFQQVTLSRFQSQDSQIASSDRPLFLFMDEYHTMATDMPQQGIGDNFFCSQARQFGCLSVFVTQNVHQLKGSQLQDNWEALFSNMLAKVFFRVGDSVTADYASSLAGRESHVKVTHQESMSDTGRSLSTSEVDEEQASVPARTFSFDLPRFQAVILGSLDGGTSQQPLGPVRVPASIWR